MAKEVDFDEENEPIWTQLFMRHGKMYLSEK